MRKALLIAFACLIISGCATVSSSRKFSDLRIGMSKSEVASALGSEGQFRGAAKTMSDGTQEVYEYTTYGGFDNAADLNGLIHHWVTFIDGKLVSVGQAGDFQNVVNVNQKIVK